MIKSLTESKFYQPGRLWSLRTAEVPHVDEDNRKARHFFTLLVDETDPQDLKSLGEIHFIRAFKEEANRPSSKFLSAAAYKNSMRTFNGVPMTTYERGEPEQMLQLWNYACTVALKIKEQQFPYTQRLDCVSGTRAVIEALGYRFSIRENDVPEYGFETRLLDRMTLPPPVGATADSLRDDYVSLHEKLKLPAPASLRPS